MEKDAAPEKGPTWHMALLVGCLEGLSEPDSNTGNQVCCGNAASI